MGGHTDSDFLEISCRDSGLIGQTQTRGTVNRHLVITRRTVREEDRAVYDDCWHQLVAAAALADMRAWRYQSTSSVTSFIEFLERSSGNAAVGSRSGEIGAITARLDVLALGHEEVWADASRRENAETPRSQLLSLVRELSLRRGDFVLSSGARSSYYIDARVTTMSGRGQRLIGQVGLDAILERGWAPRSVGGLTLGSDPIAYAIAHTAARRGMNIDAFTVRKQAKQHGTGRRIEGAFSTEGPVVVVEDVITSGESALQAVAVIREAGATIAGVLALVDRVEGGRARIEADGLEVTAVFDVTELLGA